MAIRKQTRSQGRFTRTFSTCIENINYDPILGVMEIKFHNPTIGKWRYFSVDSFTAAGLIESSSRGTYFNNYIRGIFETERVG